MFVDKFIEEIKNYIDNAHSQKDNTPEGEFLDSISGCDVSFLNQSEYNINFLLTTSSNEKYIFKVNIDTQIMMKHQINYEYEVLELLKGFQYAPNTYLVSREDESILGYGFMIRDYIPGDKITAPVDYKAIATSLAALHSHKFPAENEIIVEKRIFSERITESQRLMNKVWVCNDFPMELKRTLALLMNYCLRMERKQNYFMNNPFYVINNTFLEYYTMVYASDGIHFLDWDKAVISDPIQDIAHLLCPLTATRSFLPVITDEDVKTFIDAYMANINFKYDSIDERLNLYMPFVKLRTIAWYANLYYSYTETDKILHNDKTIETLKNFMTVDYLKTQIKDYI